MDVCLDMLGFKGEGARDLLLAVKTKESNLLL